LENAPVFPNSTTPMVASVAAAAVTRMAGLDARRAVIGRADAGARWCESIGGGGLRLLSVCDRLGVGW
jgi:hypothetical protein